MNDKHKNQDWAALSGAKYDSGIGRYNLLVMFQLAAGVVDWGGHFHIVHCNIFVTFFCVYQILCSKWNQKYLQLSNNEKVVYQNQCNVVKVVHSGIFMVKCTV